jgi:hypothetical protein
MRVHCKNDEAWAVNLSYAVIVLVRKLLAPGRPGGRLSNQAWTVLMPRLDSTSGCVAVDTSVPGLFNKNGRRRIQQPNSTAGDTRHSMFNGLKRKSCEGARWKPIRPWASGGLLGPNV